MVGFWGYCTCHRNSILPRLSPAYIREISRVQFDTKGDKSVHANVTAVIVYKLVDGKWMLWTDIFD